MKEGVKVIAVHAQTGEQIPFARVKEAAIFAGVKPTTMSYRIRSRTVDSKGYYYISGELTPEQLMRRRKRCANPPPRQYASDDQELDSERYRIINYEVRNLRECITPCPFRDYPKPMVGSGACILCTSFKGRNKKTHQVACNRHYI